MIPRYTLALLIYFPSYVFCDVLSDFLVFFKKDSYKITVSQKLFKKAVFLTNMT